MSESTVEQFGCRVAWLVAFIDHIVPLGVQLWHTCAPAVGAWVIDRGGYQARIYDDGDALAWKIEAESDPVCAWRYLSDDEVPR